MLLFDAEHFPRFCLTVGFYEASLRPNDEVINVHRRHFFLKPSGCLRTQHFLRLMFLALIEFRDQRQACCKKALTKRSPGRAFSQRRILAEKFEILAIVEYIEELLVLTRAEKIGS